MILRVFFIKKKNLNLSFNEMIDNSYGVFGKSGRLHSQLLEAAKSIANGEVVHWNEQINFLKKSEMLDFCFEF